GRDAEARRRPAGRARGQPLDRGQRSRRGGREGRRLCRPRLQAPGVPRAGPRPGAIPEAVLRAGLAQAAQEVRLMQRIELLAVPGLPMIKAGDDLGRLIGERLTGELKLRSGDVLVLAQKIVSKAEGRVVELSTVKP